MKSYVPRLPVSPKSVCFYVSVSEHCDLIFTCEISKGLFLSIMCRCLFFPSSIVEYTVLSLQKGLGTLVKNRWTTCMSIHSCASFLTPLVSVSGFIQDVLFSFLLLSQNT